MPSAQLQRRAAIFKALGHPTRLYLLEVLAEGERCVCDLTELVGADISTVSKHLAVLRQVGVVATDKRAKQVFYRLRAPCVFTFLHCLEAEIQGSSPDTTSEPCCLPPD